MATQATLPYLVTEHGPALDNVAMPKPLDDPLRFESNEQAYRLGCLAASVPVDAQILATIIEQSQRSPGRDRHAKALCESAKRVESLREEKIQGKSNEQAYRLGCLAASLPVDAQILAIIIEQSQRSPGADGHAKALCESAKRVEMSREEKVQTRVEEPTMPVRARGCQANGPMRREPVEILSPIPIALPSRTEKIREGCYDDWQSPGMEDPFIVESGEDAARSHQAEYRLSPPRDPGWRCTRPRVESPSPREGRRRRTRPVGGRRRGVVGGQGKDEAAIQGSAPIQYSAPLPTHAGQKIQKSSEAKDEAASQCSAPIQYSAPLPTHAGQNVQKSSWEQVVPVREGLERRFCF